MERRSRGADRARDPAPAHRHRRARTARRSDRRRALSRRAARPVDGAGRRRATGASCSTRPSRCPCRSRRARLMSGSSEPAPGAARGGSRRICGGPSRRDPLDVFFAPAYTAPIGVPAPLAVTIHDISFVAHPEWFRAREGLRRRLAHPPRRARRRGRLHRLAVLAFGARDAARGRPVADRGDSARRHRPQEPRCRTARRREPARAVRRVALQPPAAARPHRRLRRGDRRPSRGAARHRRGRPHVAAAGPAVGRRRARRRGADGVPALRGRATSSRTSMAARRCLPSCRSTRASA